MGDDLLHDGSTAQSSDGREILPYRPGAGGLARRADARPRATILEPPVLAGRTGGRLAHEPHRDPIVAATYDVVEAVFSILQQVRSAVPPSIFQHFLRAFACRFRAFIVMAHAILSEVAMSNESANKTAARPDPGDGLDDEKHQGMICVVGIDLPLVWAAAQAKLDELHTKSFAKLGEAMGSSPKTIRNVLDGKALRAPYLVHVLKGLDVYRAVRLAPANPRNAADQRVASAAIFLKQLADLEGPPPTNAEVELFVSQANLAGWMDQILQTIDKRSDYVHKEKLARIEGEVRQGMFRDFMKTFATMSPEAQSRIEDKILDRLF